MGKSGPKASLRLDVPAAAGLQLPDLFHVREIVSNLHTKKKQVKSHDLSILLLWDGEQQHETGGKMPDGQSFVAREIPSRSG